MTKLEIIYEIRLAEYELKKGGKKTILKPYLQKLYAMYRKAN